jgi:hypothetical protein
MRAQQQRMGALQQLQQSLAGKPEAEMIQGVISGGFPEEGAALQEGYLKRQKMAGDVAAQPVVLAKAQGETLTQALGTARTLWGQVQSPEQSRRLLEAQYADPVLGPLLNKMGTLQQSLAEMPTDPQQWAQWRDTQAMGIEAVQKMAMERDKANKPPAPPAAVAEYEYAKQQGYKGTLEQWVTSKAKAGASSVSYGAPMAGTDPHGNPVFFQPARGGGAPAIVPGVSPPKKDSALTEAQAKAATFMSQMRAAEQELAGVPIDPTKLWSQIDVGLAGGLTNVAASPAAQRARQAQEQWAESFLRFKTGAAATADEVRGNVRTFFPQPGDSPEVIAQKKRAREQAAQDIAFAAGAAGQQKPPAKPAPAAAPNMPSPDAIAAELARRRGQ